MNKFLEKLMLNNRLKLRFFSFFMLAGFTMIMLVAGFTYYYITETMTTSHEQQSKKTIERFEARVLSFIEQEQEKLQNYYQVLGSSEPETIIELLDGDPRFYDSYILDVGGVVRYASDPVRVGYNYKDREIYKLATSTHEPIFNTRYHPFEQTQLIDLIIPVFGEADELAYIAVHQLHPRWLEKELERVHGLEQGDVIIFDDEGIIFLNIRDGAGQADEKASYKPISLYDFGITLEDIDQQSAEVQNFASNEFLITYKIMDHGLGIVAKQTSLENIDMELQYMYLLIAYMAGIALIVYAGLGIRLASQTMKPIYDVTSQVKNSKQEIISVQEDSELTVLVDALNESRQENNKNQEQLMKEKLTAEEANKAKSQFLANMSHEIRTPMNGIIGLSYIAMNKNKDSAIQRQLEKIQQSAKNLLGIINDILDYSKIEAGKLLLESEVFRIREVLTSVKSMFDVPLQEKQIDFQIDVCPDLPNYVYGDSMRIRQVLLNLVGNAVKFTDTGCIKVSAHCAKKEGKKIIVTFSVQDSGIGIPADKQASLFQPFFQTDGSTTRKYGGTGLGLTISKSLVENMDGQIWMESEQGVGSTFYFTIPIETKTDANLVESLTNKKRLQVLIVDDEQSDREILTDFITSLNCNYATSTSGEEALQEIDKRAEADKKPFDLILLDYKMPGMDGFETAVQLRAKNHIEKMPVIFMVTAYDSDEVKDKAKAFDFEGFLVKPVDQSSLFDAIINVFGKQEDLFFTTLTSRTLEREEHTSSNTKSAILLVEDNIINQEIAKELLEQIGMEVTIAENGVVALQCIEERTFDLVIMDVQMPKMDGNEAARRIRAMKDATKNQIPIIAMTAHAMKGDKEKSLEAGMDDYISKPFEPANFLDKVIHWLNKNLEVAVTRDDESVTESSLPKELPGLKISEGLNRLRGKEELYVRIVKIFLVDAKKNMDGAKQAQENQDIETYKRQIHSVKGTAGNIGAAKVAELCKEMEDLLVNTESMQTEFCKDKFEEIGKELAIVYASIDELIEIHEKNIQSTIAFVNHSNFYELLDHVKDLLDKDFLIEDEVLQEMQEQLPTDSIELIGKFRELKQSLEDFHYERAKEVIMDIEQQQSRRIQ